jgi:dimethylaniline monooxygenase (N-oxide forming)
MDVCAIFRAAGKKVSWVVRPSSHGVRFGLFDPNKKPNLLGAVNIRLFTTFSPSIFDHSGSRYKFLHSGQHRVGTRITKTFWKSLTSHVHVKEAYQSQNSRKIQPETSDAFWESAYTSLIYKGSPFLKWLQDDDPDHLQVYRATPLRLEGQNMVLDEDGKEVTIKADAVIWCTGWQSSLDFFDPEESARLGIPMAMEDCDDFAPEEVLNDLDSRMDREKEILSMFPQLQTRPTSLRDPKYTQFRMYRQVLSPELLAQQDRSIAFVGFVATLSTSMAFEFLALWAVAWMEDLLAREVIPDLQSMQENVSLLNAWTRTRYGFREWKGPEFVFETQSYFDELGKDLGIEKWRKRKAAKWWNKPGCMAKEWLQPYRPRDYRGLVEEFLSNRTCQNSPQRPRAAVEKHVLEKDKTEYMDGTNNMVRVRTQEVDAGSC